MPKSKTGTATSKRRGRAVVERVHRVTLERLAEVGYERLSIPDVARLAELNKTSVYRRWATKPELVRDALTEAVAETQQDPDTGSLRGDLVAAARRVGRFVQSPRGMAVLRVLVSEGEHPEVRAIREAAMGSAMSRHAGALQRIVDRGRARGELSEDVDPALVLYAVAGALIHRVLVEGADVDDALVDRLVDLVLFGAAAGRSG